MSTTLPFPPLLHARADLKAGAPYAINGGGSFVYYGQVTPDASLGFFRCRTREVSAAKALASEVMSRFSVSMPSIGRALRSGNWFALGRHELRREWIEDPLLVQWPVGTLEVSVWKGDSVIATTLVHDPSIQHLEIIAAYDAVYHVPERLRADFDPHEAAWSVMGNVRRTRLLKQAFAARFPDQPWHALPAAWVPVTDDAQPLS